MVSSGPNPLPPVVSSSVWVTARLQMGIKGVLCATGKRCGVPWGGLDLRCLSSPCPAPHADGYTFSKELVARLQLLAGLRAAFTTSFGLTTGMKKMEVGDEPTAGEALGNPSVTMGRSVLPLICEFIRFENILSVSVPILTQGCAFQAKESV